MMASLADEYYSAEAQPAPVTFDYLSKPGNTPDDFLRDRDGKVLAFCMRNVLTPQECDELICSSEEFGLDSPQKASGTLRTGKRTSQYQNEALSKKVGERLKDLLQLKLQETGDGLGDFYGIHPNWRMVKYDKCDSFPDHQDQMDSIQIKHSDGTKDLCTSSHTLLIQLLSDENNRGAATRFYPDAKLKSSRNGQYNTAVDVFLPRGWAIVFRQKGLIHAGQPVQSENPKYIAQAGVLRLLPKTAFSVPSVFRLGPGLQDYRDLQNDSNKAAKMLSKPEVQGRS